MVLSAGLREKNGVWYVLWKLAVDFHGEHEEHLGDAESSREIYLAGTKNSCIRVGEGFFNLDCYFHEILNMGAAVEVGTGGIWGQRGVMTAVLHMN